MSASEPIFVALLSLLTGVGGFNTSSRRLKTWADTPPTDQPALFLVERHEDVTHRSGPGLPPVSVYTCDAYIYARSDDPAVMPSSVLNPLVDAIKNVIAKPDNLITNKLTLGGLVVHCWIEGRIDTDEGLLGNQSVAIIPINIKVA